MENGLDSMKTLVLGVGNELRRDDSVGLIVVRKLSNRIGGKNVEFQEASTAGLQLLDKIRNYDKIFLIDSIMTEDGNPGDWYYLSINDFDLTAKEALSHTVNLVSLKKILEDLGESVPEIRVFAVEVAEPFTFGEGLSQEVREAVPEIVEGIKKIVEGEISTKA